MKSLNAVIGLLAMLVSVFVTAHAQTGETIPGAIASGHGWAFPWRGSGIQPDVIPSMLQRTNTIVTGVVGKPAPSYLSEDQRDVYTDYPLTPAIIHYQELLETTSKPGVISDIVVSVRGGTLTILGKKIVAKYPEQPEVTPGTEYVFLLRKVGTTYRLASDYYGLFTPTNGRLVPVDNSHLFKELLRDYDTTEKLVALKHTLRGGGK